MRLLLLVSICLGCLACSSGPEVLVEVSTADPSVDSLAISVFTESDSAPVATRDTGALDEPFPQSFLLIPGSRTAGATVRIHVDGLAGGQIVAAGDAVVTLPADGTIDASIQLTDSCAGVACPRIQSCVPATGACDGACIADDGCAGLLGCSADSSCVRSGGDPVGLCDGQGADADSDGFRDARCAIDPGRNDPSIADCDDSAADANPGGIRECGAARDKDCDQVADELQLCASACGAASTSLAVGDAFQIDTGVEIDALGGLRPDGADAILYVGGADAVRSYRIDGASRGARLIESADQRGVTDLVLVGSLLFAATSDGLSVLGTDAAGGLVSVATVRPPGAGALSKLVVAEGTVWASGPGIGLAAFDVSVPEAPRFLGTAVGPEAQDLARVEGGVISVPANAAEGNLLLYTAPARGAPGDPVDLSDALGLADEDLVTAVAAQPGRGAASEREIVALAVLGATSGEVRLFERVGSSVLEPRGAVSGLALIGALHFDEGVVLYGTDSGAAGALLRGAGAGELSMVQAAEPRGAEAALRSFRATTGSGQVPLALVALGTVVRSVSFSCTP